MQMKAIFQKLFFFFLPCYNWEKPKGDAVTGSRCFMEMVRILNSHENHISCFLLRFFPPLNVDP